MFNFDFLKDNETFKSLIKGKQLHTLSSLEIHIILDEFDLGEIGQYALFFRALERRIL